MKSLPPAEAKKTAERVIIWARLALQEEPDTSNEVRFLLHKMKINLVFMAIYQWDRKDRLTVSVFVLLCYSGII